jgi:RimJ/RimL family protein N-acetyltransferase
MKVILRKLELNDWPLFAKWWRDGELIKMTSGDFESLSDDEIKNQVKEMADDTDSWHWMIQVDDKIVGHINLNKLDNQKAELQIIIGEKEYWGRGIGKQAGTQIIKKAKNFNRIYIEVRPENSRALNLYQKLGFKNLGLKKYPDNPNLPEVIMMEKVL